MAGRYVWVATFGTTHFDFMVVADSEKSAKEYMRKGLVKHAEQYGIEPDWFEPFDENVIVIVVPMNTAMRDGSPV